MHSQKVRGIQACRDAIWIVIGLVDDMSTDGLPLDTMALLMRMRGDLLGLLRVLTRAESQVLAESRPAS